jgi:hypothetical protein
MRITSYILALLVLLLSCIPCSDRAVQPSGRSANIIQTKAASTRNAHTDSCSPFCICACCATTRVQSEPVEYSLHNIDNAITHTAFYSSFVQQCSFAVWQPPQLV